MISMSSKSKSNLVEPFSLVSHGFAENIKALEQAFGYPDNLDWKLKRGKKLSRIESDDPVATATMFAGIASEGFVSEVVNARGYRRELADGTIVGLRLVSSSDGSPAVDLNIADETHMRKIHFIKGGN